MAQGSEAQERGYRVDIAVHLTRMNLVEFGKKHAIPISTLYAWKNGQICLTKRSAVRLKEALEKEGFTCSVEWLLNGEGVGPRSIKDLQEGRESLVDFDSSDTLAETSPERLILREVSFFRSLYPNSLVLYIQGDAMVPSYFPGDYVAGQSVDTEDDLTSSYNRNCLVELPDNTVLVRRVSPGQEAGTVTLSCLNPNTTEASALITNITPIKIAPVVWHRTGSL